MVMPPFYAPVLPACMQPWTYAAPFMKCNKYRDCLKCFFFFFFLFPFGVFKPLTKWHREWMHLLPTVNLSTTSGFSLYLHFLALVIPWSIQWMENDWKCFSAPFLISRLIIGLWGSESIKYKSWLFTGFWPVSVWMLIWIQNKIKITEYKTIN